MTQEDKELLFKDLCARLPYGVKIYTAILPDKPVRLNSSHLNLIGDIKILPYLRPMSSMTEEENVELLTYLNNSTSEKFSSIYYLSDTEQIEFWEERETNKRDWFNANHFDYRGLIEKGLALEAPEGMYKIN